MTEELKEMAANPLFNENQDRMPAGAKNALERDLVRSLFFTKVLVNEVACNNQSHGLSVEVKQEGKDLLRAMETYIANIRPLTNKKKAWWLQQQLKKDKMADLAILMETFVQIDGKDTEEIFEWMTTIMSTLVFLLRTKKSINIAKYHKFFEMLDSELQVDINGGESGFGLTDSGALAIGVTLPKPKKKNQHVST